MVNAQLQSRVIHFDLRCPYHRSALAKIVSHPDVAGQKSVCGWGSDKSPTLLSSGCSIRRRRSDGDAQERRDKRDRKNGFHDRAANAVLDITRPPYPWFRGPIKQERNCRYSRGSQIVERIPGGTAPGAQGILIGLDEWRTTADEDGIDAMGQ
jgi:hypothetical protein